MKQHQETRAWMTRSIFERYSYNFTCLGRPIIQYPQDMIAVQELIWCIKPDLIIETGIAHGGSLIQSASFLALLDVAEAIDKPHDSNWHPKSTSRKVLGIDIDIRDHNVDAIKAHPMSNWIEMIEGSSVCQQVLEQVKAIAKNFQTVLVFLDSNHTHDHVLEELRNYSQFVSPGSYCVVFDTIIDDLPDDTFPDRPWGATNNPKTAIREFLNENSNFEIDVEIDQKLQISVAPNGYLRRIESKIDPIEPKA